MSQASLSSPDDYHPMSLESQLTVTLTALFFLMGIPLLVALVWRFYKEQWSPHRIGPPRGSVEAHRNYGEIKIHDEVLPGLQSLRW